ncbi:type I restriction enzyme S subunit [Mariniflexile fucanivorans]|uniref:Type I restriction enzyme S subunit n=1 Tax=Mariniflexile fucanivorans TaxID=264023 RepID=A0A4R1RSE3_9FLAO|nr:restriction endonuclease subunit S [Mariniflexile fucanivorans]TCL69294.1 type I restriction enzyme S subunit [Mariniflexile fucanivorans]
MERYESYRSTDLDLINEIPVHWQTGKMNYFMEVKDGTHDSPSYVDEDEFSFPLVTSKDLVSGNLEFNKCKFITKEDHYQIIKRSDVSKGDILMPMIGTVGSPVIVKTDREFSIKNVALFKTSNSNKINVSYLNYLLSSDFVERQFDLNSNGGVQNFVSLSVLRKLNVFYFPINEQTHIANYLDHQTAIIDALIEKKELLIQKLQAQRQAIINEAVTKGLNPNANMKDSGIEWLGEIPEHWEVKKLKHLGESITGITYSPDDVTDNGTLVLRSSNIQNGKLELNDTVYVNKQIAKKYITITGDILLCSRNGSRNLIGKNIMLDARVENQSWGAFMTIYRSDYNSFMYYFFNSDIFTGLSSLFLSSTINQLTIGVLNNMQIAFPTDENERESIIRELKTQTKKLNKIISLNNMQIKKLKSYRQSIISEAVTGKIDVRDWQPKTTQMA